MRIQARSGRLILPECVTIHLLSRDASGTLRPSRVHCLPFNVHTFGCRKNNYRLGPFFSDAEGRVVITRELAELSVRDTLDTGLMDYGDICECAPDVEIRNWTSDDIDRCISARQNGWTMLLSGERQIYSSLDELLRRLRAAPRLNQVAAIRDRWDGTRPVVEHQCVFPDATL
jgi:hypothetical protein